MKLLVSGAIVLSKSDRSSHQVEAIELLEILFLHYNYIYVKLGLWVDNRILDLDKLKISRMRR